LLDTTGWVDGSIEDFIDLVGIPETWESIIPNMKGFTKNDEKNFFTVWGPTDIFGNKMIFGNRLTGVRYFDLMKNPDPNADIQLSYKVAIGGEMPADTGLSSPPTHTFFFLVRYHLKPGTGKNEGRVQVRRVATEFEQRRLKLFPVPLIIPLKLKMYQENWKIAKMMKQKNKTGTGSKVANSS